MIINAIAIGFLYVIGTIVTLIDAIFAVLPDPPTVVTTGMTQAGAYIRWALDLFGTMGASAASVLAFVVDLFAVALPVYLTIRLIQKLRAKPEIHLGESFN